MYSEPMSKLVERSLRRAANRLGTANPVPYVKPLLDRTFYLPPGHEAYAMNTLTPGAAPLETSFSEEEPDALRFVVEPRSLDAPPVSRRDEATREMRRLVGTVFGPGALRWFDSASEEYRGFAAPSDLHYGAFFGTVYDRDGLCASKVYYEMTPDQVRTLATGLAGLAQRAMRVMPSLYPLFNSIACRKESGRQRITFLHRGPLSLNSLGPLLRELGLEASLPRIMQVFGLALGGRFALPEQSVLVGLGNLPTGPEFELYVLLGMIPDLPSSFLQLIHMGLAEHPKELNAFNRWLNAFTPEESDWPGNFSVLSVHVTKGQPARVSLYLRPMEFEISQQLQQATAGAGAT